MPLRYPGGRSHDHYSQEVQDATAHFRDLWQTYDSMTWVNLTYENDYRHVAVQNAWDALARLRKKETGSGFYVEPKEG